jgi:hypothetical protein
MRKITVMFLLGILLLLAAPKTMAQYAQAPKKSVELALPDTDLRVKALRAILEKYNSPLVPFARDYIEIADKYNIDWKLLPAIAGLESSFGNAQLSGSYNSYGWGGGHIYFESVPDGINTVLYALKTKYFSRGADTVESIAPIYSESPTWAPRVRRFMGEIDSAYQKENLQKLSLTI